MPTWLFNTVSLILVQEMMQAFRVFDKDGNGYITAKELKTAMHEMGMPLSDEEVQLMIKEKDVNGDGVIDYNEFIAINASTKG